MTAWHGDAELKERTVQRMREHREADTFRQMTYFSVDPKAAKGFRGCFLGCLVAEDLAALHHVPLRRVWSVLDDGEGWAGEAERLFGIPTPLADVFDNTFEDQDDGEAAAAFAINAVEAIPVGADLSGLADRWSLLPRPEQTADRLLAMLREVPVPEVAQP